MSNSGNIGFKLSIIIQILGEKMYSSPLVFVRENVQNAVDATRLLVKRQGNRGRLPKIKVTITPDYIEVEDWGIGMTEDDIREYYWNVGKSSKQTVEAKEAGCVGQFGIGGFANFGVCSEVHLYTQASNQRELYSFVKKKDLEADRSEYPIQPSDKLNHQGTLIRCLPLNGKFDVNSITSYLEKYVQYLPEYITLNNNLISQKEFIEENQPKKEQRQEYKFKYGRISGLIREYDEKITFRPKSGVINGEDYILNGEIEILNNKLYIYKNNFLIAEYVQPYNGVILSGNIDLPFVKPNASREALDDESGLVVIEFHKATIKVLVNYVASSSKLLNNNINNLINFIYQNDEVELIENLTVTLLNSKELTLKELKKQAEDPNVKIYYLKGQASDKHKTIQNRGGIIILTYIYDYRLKNMVVSFLTKYCKAIETPTIFPTECISTNKLKPNYRYVINKIEQNIERQRCTDLKVQGCKLDPEHIPMMLEDSEKTLYINIYHKDFIELTNYSDHNLFDCFVDRFIRDNIEDSLARYRQKIFGKGMGLSSFVSQGKYKVVIKVLETLNLVKAIKDLIWKGPEETLIKIESKDFPEQNGCYLRLPDDLVDSYKEHIICEHQIEVVAFSKRVIFLLYYEIGSCLLIDIQLDRPVFFENKGSNDRTISKKDIRHILSYPNKSIYLPIPSELESSFNPKGTPKEISIGVKLDEY